MSCSHCGARFANRLQLGAHIRYCAGVQLRAEQSGGLVAIPVVEEPQRAITLHSLTRRRPSPWGRVTTWTAPVCGPARYSHNEDYVRDYRQVQNMWSNYVQVTRGLCADSFWELFNTVRKESTVCRDAVMSCAKTLLGYRGQRWPRSTRVLRKKILKNAGRFWDVVTRTCTIDLTSFQLPGVDKVPFSFIDPLYMWINRCNKLIQAGKPLHWDPTVLHHPENGEEVYGAGIQYSLLLRAATSSLHVEGDYLYVRFFLST